MPTPVGHALGGLVCGWLIAPQPLQPAARSASLVRHALAFGALGALADIDLLFHTHSTYTHSLGAALLVTVLVMLLVRLRPSGAGTRLALACGAAYASHVLLDWLGTDTSPPYGITALWPFSSAFYYSGLDLFPAVDRRYWLPGFWQRAVTSITWELITLLPLTLLVLWLRAWLRATRSRRHAAQVDHA
jgi:membrane-bound metal-dependent hydrolase YbcI (DUF457 family)